MQRDLIRALVILAWPAALLAQTPAGSEFRVNTYTTSWQLDARAAIQPKGDFVVVWSSYGQDGSQYGVFGQRFSAAGVALGGEFQANTATTFHQTEPAVAIDARGDFVVVWTTDDGSGPGIAGRRYDAGGNAVGAEFLVNLATYRTQYHPRVGMAADGGFVVAWLTDTPYAGIDVMARRFDAHGVPSGGDMLVNTRATGHQFASDVAVAGDGSFVVVWVDKDVGGTLTDIVGQRFDAAGNRLGAEFTANTAPASTQRFPSVGVSPAGGFVVAWTRPDAAEMGMVARRYDASGAPQGTEFAVNTSTLGNQYGRLGQVAHDTVGNFTITWTSTDFNGFPGSGHYWWTMARRFSATGVPRGGEVLLNDFTTLTQLLPSVASDAAGNLVVVWYRMGLNGDKDVFARRVGGLAPAALQVDGPGNAVLEPGETVDVRPTWRNLNGAAQTFSATLSALSGPAGATYATLDGSGDYGTVADGAAALCADCYRVQVSDPPVRPVLHWDASAVESILPDSQGQQKPWLLHVGRSFTDVAVGSGFYRFVETLLHQGVTAGCAAREYCPTSSTTREQMAVFVLVARDPGQMPADCGATPLFADVPAASPYCRWIEELARRGVVGGCGGGNYCPTAASTREQMAVFVLRTLDPALMPPACGTPVFTDVPASSPFCPWVEELARRGIVTGCGGGAYCPTLDVSREQMSVFLAATFGLELYGP